MAFAAFIPLVTTAVSKILDLIPDTNARARAEAELHKQLVDIAAEESRGQLAINQEEARHSSIFVAGWRPFIGWVCGISLAYAFVIRPTIVWAVMNFAPQHIGNIPDFPMDYLMELLCAMLGLGSLRTFEKIKRVA